MFRNLSNAAIHRRGIGNHEMQSHNTGDMTMSINILSESNFDSIVGEKTALIDFGAEWCVYCKKIAPIIEEIAAEKTDLVFGYVDVDLQPMLAARFRRASILKSRPTNTAPCSAATAARPMRAPTSSTSATGSTCATSSTAPTESSARRCR